MQSHKKPSYNVIEEVKNEEVSCCFCALTVVLFSEPFEGVQKKVMFLSGV
jgi:hypothetical protein